MELRLQPAKSDLNLELRCLLKLLSSRTVISTLDLMLTFYSSVAPPPAFVVAATPFPGFASHRPPQEIIRFRVLRGTGHGGGNAHARRDPARAERAAGRLRVREGRPRRGGGSDGSWPGSGRAGVSGRDSGLPGHAGIRGWSPGPGQLGLDGRVGPGTDLGSRDAGARSGPGP